MYYPVMNVTQCKSSYILTVCAILSVYKLIQIIGEYV